MSQIADSHDNWCNCDHPFAHILASIFPPGHRDRSRTINQILERDFREQCLSGGAVAENSGLAAEDIGQGLENTEKEDQKEEDLPRDELEELLAAAENVATR